MNELQQLTARRYVQPLREGGSLPAIIDTEDGLFVVKFRGAGQGPRALVAELIVGGIAQAIGLPTPDLAIVQLPDEFGRAEPDPEIQDLLRASHGVNVGLRFLDGAFNFDPRAACDLVTDDFASRLVWLDAFTSNVDRTHRNPNLIICNRTAFLIDHGAALYFHHNWDTVDEARMRAPFQMIEQHVLLSRATEIAAADAHAMSMLTAAGIERIVARVPDALLDLEAVDPAAARARYVGYLRARLDADRAFVSAAIAAHERILRTEPQRLEARR